ncbi:MAG: Yip1 family protein [Promethearchaeota archaeon]
MSSLRCPECLIRVGSTDAVCPQCGYRFRVEQFERILPFMRRPEKQWESRLSFRQRLWGVLRIPSITFWDIAHEPDTRGPMLLFLANLVVISLWYVAMTSKIVGVTINPAFGFLGVLLVLALLYMLLNIFYFGIIHIIVRYSGNRDEPFSITFLMGQYALLPFLLANLLSLGLLMAFLPYTDISSLALLYLHPIWLIVYGLACAALLWCAILLSMGLRERHRLSTTIALISTLSVTLFVVITVLLVRLTVMPLI